MFEQGFIMREIQKMVQTLQAIIGLKKEGSFGEALREIDQSYERFFDLSREDLTQKNWNEIVKRCSPGDQFSAEIAYALADIINEEAAMLDAMNKTLKAKQKYSLALALYEKALKQKEAAVPLDALRNMKAIRKKLE